MVEPKLKYTVALRLDSLRCPERRREPAAREERTDRDRHRLKPGGFHAQTVSAGAADCQNPDLLNLNKRLSATAYRSRRSAREWPLR